MNKLVLTLAIMVMAAQIYYGIQNQNLIKGERALKNYILVKEVPWLQDNWGETRKKKIAKQKDLETEQQLKAEREEQLRIKGQSIEQRQAAIAQVDSEIKVEDVEIAKIEDVLKDLNVTPEELKNRIDELKRTAARKKTEKDEITNLLNDTNEKIVVNEATLRKYEERQDTRTKKIKQRSLIASIRSVNNDFGFVVVNAGKNNGVTQDSSLLVKRGTNRIARLSINKLNDTSVVADIVEGSMPTGERVLPSDQVVFQTAP